MRDAGRAVSGSVRRILALLRSSLRGHTAVALWIDSRTGIARIRDAETASDNVLTGPFSDRAGILGILRKRTEPFILNDISGGDGFLPWYEEGHEPAHAMGMPLYDEGILVGYLCIDRQTALPCFDDVDAIALQSAAEEIIGAVHTERLVVEACRSRHEMALLYEAADAFNQALTPYEVCEVAFGLVSRVCAVDMLVVSRLTDDGGQEVIFAEGLHAEKLTEHRFDDDASLAALAVRRQHCLPYNGKLENGQTAIFGEGTAVPELRSLVIFPMSMGQHCVGSLALGARVRNAYEVEHRDQLRVIVSYASAALANAFAYSNAVNLATTDGMTGLTNHRTFKERGVQALARADRSGRPASLIMTDIDHFKSINDTYGHSTGDEVIKAVARVLHDNLRKIDLGARYGGEEFAILLEDTDTDAAASLAERLRRQVAALEFEADGKVFRVTISLGVASHPDAATELPALVEAADQCLYAAKRGGRNQVVRADSRPASAAA